MKERLVLTVGNTMMGDDAAGPLLARLARLSPLEGWDVLDGGSVPENCVFRIREMPPREVVIIDAADMHLEPGSIRLIDQEAIGSLFLLTTHSLPLSYLVRALREFVPRVDLIGIQPELVGFGLPLSARVKQAVGRVYAWLRRHDERTDLRDEFPRLTMDSNEAAVPSEFGQAVGEMAP